MGQGNGNANYASRSMDGLCFARESYGMKIEMTDINKTLDKIELQSWRYYINHIMANTISCAAELPIKKCCSLVNCLDSNVDRLIWGIRGIAVSQWENIKFYSGADVQVNKHRKYIKSNSDWETDVVSQDSGIFTELILDVLPNKRFIGGTRLEYSVFNFIDCSDYSNSKKNMIYPAGFIRYENSVSPFLLYYIGVGTSLRFPDYWELIINRSNKDSSEMDDVFQLKPERAAQIDIGTCFQYLQTSGWLSSYVGYIKNFILCNYSNEGMI